MRSVIGTTALKIVAALVGFGAIMALAFLTHGPADILQTGAPPAAPTAQPTRAEVLVERYDCWRLGESPPADMAGQIPGHAIVTLPAADKTVYRATLVGPALEQVAHDYPDLGWRPAIDRGLIVHGFCR